MNRIEYKAWKRKYFPVVDDFGNPILYDYKGADKITISKIDLKNLWTIVCFNGVISIYSGIFRENIIGHYITKGKWTEDIKVTVYPLTK